MSSLHSNSNAAGDRALLVEMGRVPAGVSDYLSHTVHRQRVRDIARRKGCAPSTICRRVREIEARRDDPLFDEALSRLSDAISGQGADGLQHPKEARSMTAQFRLPNTDTDTISKEARRILRRLCETDAVLAVAQGMDRAVVLRPGPAGEQTRTAVVDRGVAQSFAVKDWISCAKKGSRLTQYTITSAGKAALKRLLEEERKRRLERNAVGFAEGPTPFQGQHAQWGARKVAAGDGKVEALRVNLGESPLGALARRKGPDGKPFLTPDLVQAAERLREDFERAQMGPRVGQNWDRFLSGADRGGFLGDCGIGEGPSAARQRVSDALDAMGPGLADVVLRVCCFLEGLESAEKRLGWSARSGKVVLKIGLQRLAQHYCDDCGFVPAMRG